MVLIFARPVHRRSVLFLLAGWLSVSLSVGLLSVPESAIKQSTSQSAVRGRNWGAHAL